MYVYIFFQSLTENELQGTTELQQRTTRVSHMILWLGVPIGCMVKDSCPTV